MSYPISQEVAAKIEIVPEIHSTIHDIKDSLENLEDELNMLCTRVSSISSPPTPQTAEAYPPRSGIESSVGNELASILNRVRTARDTLRDTRIRLCV